VVIIPRREVRGFIWIPRDLTTAWDILIDGVSVKADVVDASFTHGIIGVESPCEVQLIDDGSRTYTGGEVIELKIDFTDGTTSKWKGKLEQPKKSFSSAYMLKLKGSHHQAELLDIMVNKSYSGTSTDDAVLKDLISTYLIGYTSTNVASATTSGTYSWNEKPFYDCIIDICNNAGFYCYVDSDKDFHFFERGSIENEDEAIVWNDNLLDLSDGFGTDETEIRNKIKVYGEDDAGLPVIYTSEDESSQDSHGVKEKVIKDTSIKNSSQASTVGDAEKANLSESDEAGTATTLIMPLLSPGDKIWITNPEQKIHGQYNIIQFTHTLPVEQTSVVVANDKSIPSILKERKQAEQRQESLTNPYGMKSSYNLGFSNTDDIDSSLSSNVSISDGYLVMTSAGESIMISNVRNESADRTYFHLKVVGDYLTGVTYYVSIDNGSTFNSISLETETLLTAGSQIRIRVVLTNVETKIKGIALLMR